MKSYVRNTINLSCAKILLPSVIRLLRQNLLLIIIVIIFVILLRQDLFITSKCVIIIIIIIVILYQNLLQFDFLHNCDLVLSCL